MKRLMPWVLIVSVLLSITYLTQVNRTVFEETPHNKGSREELYQDIIMSFLTPHLEKAVSNYYGRRVTVAPYSVRILSVTRPNGYRTFKFTVKLEVAPYVGPHLTVGVDHVTLTVGGGGEVVIKGYEHIESHVLPPHWQ